ncbi:hypothetical protein AN5039.2 [Aspergillus nidulans FGSC A4]|uniref:DUF6536 domain-containing protein n=1 Tax=Emericella nidulans (strain FGSC A4 / ATCC 38163 / CBS 112.46 / NRRL 194 / M139) TaxID=227321 RepID=Q5B341_EMENI|nr:hypothetical protein [Aspergillus nidulans FGSC A4]EAA61117.1 hypothetical protein AN5039.2 [Aspergillus nidulans FGSC A4]CBF76225.1 TPA: conserved hypothetical protein [Aspergillus nidulans FGSC A4]|eukprot:XP_662643.1 hypothetical protein AN5039.2 [Aspergillus nidulans FGSC A4]
MHLSHILVMFSKGKDRLNRVQAKYRIENIPLPFVKQDIQAGQEWIRGAMLCALVTASIGILNVILTIIAAGIAYSKKASDTHLTYAEIYEGDCSITSNWTTGMHLVINVLSSILLAASNYVMQCLSAPSRVDIDRAHSKDRENLGGSSSLASFDQMRGYLGARPDFISQSSVNSFYLETQHWNYPIWSFKYKGSGDWGDLFDLCYTPWQGQNDAACYDRAIDTRTLQDFLWTENPTEMQLGNFFNTASNWRNSSWAAEISFRIDVPSDPGGGFSMLGECPCEIEYTDGLSHNITISGCMTSDAQQHCQLYFSLPICIAVIVCNIIKVLCMYMTAKKDRKEIFLTIGDALSSFLDKPDATTRGQSVLPANDITYGLRSWAKRALTMPFKNNLANVTIPRETSPQLFPKRKRWIQAASWRRWAFTYILYLPQPK